MARGRSLSVLLAFSLLSNALTAPSSRYRPRRASIENELDSMDTPVASHYGNSVGNTEHNPPSLVTTAKFDDEEDDEDFPDIPPQPAPGGGSNLFSLLRLAGALLPSLSGGISDKSKIQPLLQKVLKAVIRYNETHNTGITRRQDIHDNEIDIDYTVDLKPPAFQRQESGEENNNESSNSEDSDEDESSESDDGSEEESSEDGNGDNGTNSKQDSDSNGNGDESDYDDDEPPEGDGQGGGILGLLAGLSGGEDSDLGSLLAAVSGIVANLSGDGFDLNALIASGLGLFAGLLSEGDENPGAVLASYLLTSLDTITGGGANNNGAFFGNFLTTLIKGTSAAGDQDSSSDENDNKTPMADSAGFIFSLLMSLLGDMSKTSSGGSSKPW